MPVISDLYDAPTPAQLLTAAVRAVFAPIVATRSAIDERHAAADLVGHRHSTGLLAAPTSLTGLTLKRSIADRRQTA